MIEKLVALIRENRKDSDSLIVADVIEQHGDKITNEIVGAALCELFNLESPPDQGVTLRDARQTFFDDATNGSQYVMTDLVLRIFFDLPDHKEVRGRINSRLGTTIYGNDPWKAV